MTPFAVGLLVIAGCGGGSSTSPETFWADLETAVTDFDADLDEIDADYRGRSSDIPDDPDERAEFFWRTEVDIGDAYIDAWQDFVDELDELEPPEGYPDGGEDYAEGLPDYFESAIVENERAALAAVKSSTELWGDVSDPVAAYCWTGDLPEDETRRLDEAFDEVFEIEDTLEDEWELFQESAEAVAHPIDDAVELRTDEIGVVLWRASELLFDIEDEAGIEDVC